jgi:hypothetical protein
MPLARMAEDTSASWVSAAIGHTGGMLFTHLVRSLASLGAVCTLRFPCPMVSLSPLSYSGLLSSRVREAEAPRHSTWTSAEIVPFCRLASPPVPLSLLGNDRMVDTKSSPHARTSGVSEVCGTVFAEPVYAELIP